MAYTFVKMLAPAGLHNNPNHTMIPQYITIHNTMNCRSGATARKNAEYVCSGSGSSAQSVGTGSWHYSVDDLEVCQTFEETQQCYHAGDGKGPGNTKSIGIEICTNHGITIPGVSQSGCTPWAQATDAQKEVAAKLFQAACDNAARLTAEILSRRGWDISRVKQHNDWSGKDCPMLLRHNMFSTSWEWFLSLVNKYLGTSGSSQTPSQEETAKYRVNTSAQYTSSQLGAWISLESAKRQAEENSAAGYKVYEIQTGALLYDPLSQASCPQVYGITTANLNVRSSPSTSSAPLGVLPKGSRISYRDLGSGWAQTKYQGNSAYVSTHYLRRISAYGTTTANLNMRSGPGTRYRILCTIPKGTDIAILEIGDWQLVSYQSQTGYAAHNYIRIQEEGSCE